MALGGVACTSQLCGTRLLVTQFPTVSLQPLTQEWSLTPGACLALLRRVSFRTGESRSICSTSTPVISVDSGNSLAAVRQTLELSSHRVSSPCGRCSGERPLTGFISFQSPAFTPQRPCVCPLLFCDKLFVGCYGLP